jgi:uncharacterized metal-binding protein YceD (DUF177 family)
MKIEFKKAPQSPKDFETEFDSVKIVGTFCKITASLVKIDATLIGDTSVKCCRCGKNDTITIDEKLNFLLCDGIYKNGSSENEDLIIEVEDSLIDFDQIIQSEVSSIFSDYHICTDCADNDFIEQEY